MKTFVGILLLVLTLTGSAQTIVCPPGAPAQIALAAREVRRYVYLRTSKLLPIAEFGEGVAFKLDPKLGPQAYRLKSTANHLLISGGSELAVLYGAYAFAEQLGVRFQLDGDVIPDAKIPLVIPALDLTNQPLFELRGILPFHDFMEGPDWWNAADYKACLAQLLKMRMNFIGLHSYPWHKPWKHVPPEPGVWIGLPEDLDPQGHVNFSYPVSWANTARPGPLTDNAWGHKPGKTATFSAGAAQLFPQDDYGAEVMDGLMPWPVTPEQCNLLFNRVGDLFADVFAFAHRLGVQTCIGTETPFWVPDEVRTRLEQQGRNPQDPAVLRELCRGMFARIQRSHPVDYFWVWTPERELDAAKTQADLRLIAEVAGEQNPPVAVAVCGWGWLANQFATFDRSMPKDMVFSCINDALGFAPVTSEFGKLQDRPRWCIPWLEDDTSLTTPQLFAGRVQQDALAAKRFACTGLMGLHWRSRVIAPNLAMLAQSGWNLSLPSGPLRDVLGSEGTVASRLHPQRATPTETFYQDWCQAQFGAAVGPAAAKLFAQTDGRLPRPACWALEGTYGSSAGPGIVGDADPRSWDTVAKEYSFAGEFAALRPGVQGAGNLARFDYWNGQFQYLKAMGKLRCTRAELARATQAAEQSPAQPNYRALIKAALQTRRQLVADWTALMTHLLETVSTPGELGTVANLELHTRLSGGYLTDFDSRLEQLLGHPLPADCDLPNAYAGHPRLVVPAARTILSHGETLALKIIALDRHPVKSVIVKVRPLGRGRWQTLEASHLARAIWRVELPATADDFEYYVAATTATGNTLCWPPTAPENNQTVVVTPL